MHHTYNAVELVNRWVNLTGTPEAEARQRVRVLRLAGMLPDARLDRQEAITDNHIATFLIAALASEQHLSAPEKAQQYASLSAIDMASSTPLDGMKFGDALTDLLRRSRDPSDPWRVDQISVNLSHPYVELWIRNGLQTGVGVLYGEHPSHSAKRDLSLTTIRQLDGRILADLARKPKDETAVSQVVVASKTGKYDRTEAAAMLTSIGCWTLPQHLTKLAKQDAGPKFTVENGSPVYLWASLVAYAGVETEARKDRRAERRATNPRK